MKQAVPVFAALIAALATATAAWRAESLTFKGALAAAIIGTTALSASWRWGVLLIAWFVSSSLLSRLGKAHKSRRVAAIVMKGDRRDAWQVWANGGLFFMASMALIFVAPRVAAVPELNGLLAVCAAASLAAAAADTWATEIGALYGGSPWSLRTRARVEAGTSGAMSLAGTSAMLAGGVSIAAMAAVLGMIPANIRSVAAVACGGIVGALADTLVGAWLQERRWCKACAMGTEQIIHVCGTESNRAGGIARLDNDLVNALCTVAGAVAAMLFRLA